MEMPNCRRDLRRNAVAWPLRNALWAQLPGWIWNDEEEMGATLPAELRPGMLVMLHRDVGG
jgi:hypothetical protein